MPLAQKKTEYHTVGDEENRGGWFRGKKPKQAKVEVVVTPPLFDDLSQVRMGREADDVVQVMRAEGDIRTGVSSPKRYLWADDASWLEGANWFMADPADRCHTGTYASTLRGPFLKYVHEDDREFGSLLPERRQQGPRIGANSRRLALRVARLLENDGGHPGIRRRAASFADRRRRPQR
jgi:hypothetical protein